MARATADRNGIDLAQAIAKARQARAQAPEAPEPLFALCALLLRHGDPAANELLPQLEAFRTYGAGWQHLGDALMQLQHWEGASVAFARAEAANPADLASAFGLGRALQAQGRNAEAAAIFERVVARAPDFAAAWYALGLMRDEQGDPAAATAYRQALKADPSLHEAALNLGIANQEQGDLEGALDAYGHAFRTRPEAIGRIAHALASSPTGCLFLDLGALQRLLGERAAIAPRSEALAINARS